MFIRALTPCQNVPAQGFREPNYQLPLFVGALLLVPDSEPGNLRGVNDVIPQRGACGDAEIQGTQS